MKTHLHKLKEGFVLTSDEQPLRDYKGLMLNTVVNKLFTDMGVSLMQDFKKVIVQQDQLDFSSLTPEEQKKIGWFDVEILAQKYAKSRIDISTAWGSYVDGFQKAQELLYDRMFTLEDMKKGIDMGFRNASYHGLTSGEILNSLTKTSWEVEIEVVKIDKRGTIIGSNIPKWTDGKIKILKLK